MGVETAGDFWERIFPKQVWVWRLRETSGRGLSLVWVWRLKETSGMGLPQNNYGCGDCRRLLEEDFHWVWRLQKTFGRGLALDVETAGDFRERTFTGCGDCRRLSVSYTHLRAHET